MVDVDIQTAIDELYRMNETMSRYPQNLIEIKDLLQSRHNIIIVKEIAEQADSFSDTMKYSLIDMLIKARNIREFFIVNNNCSRLNHTIIFAFLDLFEGTKPLPESNIISESLNNFLEKYGRQEIFQCLISFPKLSTEAEKILKSREYRNYKKLIDVKNIALKFTSRINDLRKLADRGLNEIKESFRFSRPAWDGNSENYNQTQIKNAFEHFLVSAEEIYKYQTIEYTPSSIHTAGFLGSKDMKKVIGDLKRPWFKKNIARGASTKNLEKALLLFRKVPQTIIDLETSWKKKDSSYFVKLQNVISSLISITLFTSNMVPQTREYLDSLSEVKNKLEIVKKEIMTVNKMRPTSDSNAVLSLTNARQISEAIGLCTRTLKNMDSARRHRKHLLSIKEFEKETEETLRHFKLRDWEHPSTALRDMLDKIDELNQESINLKNDSLDEMTGILEKAAKINGMPGKKTTLQKFYKNLSTSSHEESYSNDDYYFNIVQNLDLQFSDYHGRLRNSREFLALLKNYFDEIFGEPNPKNNKKSIEPAVSITSLVFIIIGIIFVILIVSVLVYGLTEAGRTKYKNLYLYYFGKPEEFEKRWRYSLFMDQFNLKNSLLDAVREVNKTNLLKVLKNGAYVNVYNKYGNTALHVATKLGHVELVDVLIRYGADRTLLNSSNRLPEEMLPFRYRAYQPEKADQYDKIKAIYKKYKNKKFRKSVPQVFPVHSFHIFIDDRTETNLTNTFMEKFQSITSDEAMETTTHFVVKTDQYGVMETDRLDLLLWIFNGVIIVKEQWMTDCLDDEKIISQDYNYLVENIKYKGVIYNSILTWTEYMAKGKMPFLIGVYVALVMEHYDNLLTLTAIIESHGGIVLNEFPLKGYFNKNAHPYLHANLGPIFLIHDGSIDLNEYKNDPDRLYNLFTEEEFVIFLLKHEINIDTRENPIPAIKEKAIK